MKKLFIILVAVAFVFGAVSCKKTCECRVYVDGFFIGSIDSSEKISKADCDKMSQPEFLGEKVECKLK